MPKTFKFFVDHAMTFSCRLESEQCTSNSRTGNRCRNRTVIGVNTCWRHLLSEKQVRIKDSQYGKGLFAMNNRKEDNAVIFRANATIVKYNGEIVNQAELDRRYGDATAPYGAQRQGEDVYEDGACKRGVGTLVNHATGNNTNARFSYARNGSLQIKATKNIRNNREIFINYNQGVRQQEQRYLFNEAGVRHETR
jgi:hypothetical protein